MRTSRSQNCISLALSQELMCDACQKFKERKIGLSGRKPSPGEEPNCSKLWVKKDAIFSGRKLLQKRVRDEVFAGKKTHKEKLTCNQRRRTSHLRSDSSKKAFKCITNKELCSPSIISQMLSYGSQHRRILEPPPTNA